MYANPGGYDAYMGRWSAVLAPAFLPFACVRRPASILDIGCGAGSLLRAAVERWPASRLVGIDPVPAFIGRARSTIGPDRVDLVAGAVEALPFAGCAFECCLSLLVLQEIEDRALALSEMRRVTRADGVVAACQWDFVRGMPIIAALRDALEIAAPGICKARNPGASHAFSSEAELSQCWHAAGLSDVETARIGVTLTYANFTDLWEPLLSGSTPMTSLVVSLPPHARDEVRMVLKQKFAGSGRDVPFAITSAALAVRGRAASAFVGEPGE